MFPKLQSIQNKKTKNNTLFMLIMNLPLMSVMECPKVLYLDRYSSLYTCSIYIVMFLFLFHVYV